MWPKILALFRTNICIVRNMTKILALFRTNICIVRNMTMNPGHLPDKVGTIPDKVGTILDITGTISDWFHYGLVTFQTMQIFVRNSAKIFDRILVTFQIMQIFFRNSTKLFANWCPEYDLGHISDKYLHCPEHDQNHSNWWVLCIVRNAEHRQHGRYFLENLYWKKNVGKNDENSGHWLKFLLAKTMQCNFILND